MNASPARIAESTFPGTRYQGSKRKLAGALLEHLRPLEFSTVLDAFGGTGAIAHALKSAGKRVTYNDLLASNHQIGLALIENDVVRLSEEDVGFVLARDPLRAYDDFIERTYDGIYFTRDENRWLDTVAQNIPFLPCPYRRALAWFGVFQSAIIKRPYNLFHRGNLYMRLSTVQRSFGNKTTWDGGFEDYFRRFAAEAGRGVIDSGGICRATCKDALEVEGDFDLIYMDTPYVRSNRVGTDYHAFYHFLEGLVGYREWPGRIDHRYRHLPLRSDRDSAWLDADRVCAAFEQLFDRFRDSILCVSYRSDGIPSIEQLASTLRTRKRNVEVHALQPYQYALSTARNVEEVLLIGS